MNKENELDDLMTAYRAWAKREDEDVSPQAMRAFRAGALAQAPAPSDVYPCVKLTVSEDGSVAASLYAPGLPAGVFNVYPLGIEDVSTGAPAPSGEVQAAAERLINEVAVNGDGEGFSKDITLVAQCVQNAPAPTPEQAGPSGEALTPSSHWHKAGEADPHAKHYDCERAALAMGNLTDDELANGAFMNYDHRPPLESILAGTAHSPIAWMTAVKDRIRWLSRSLERALASPGAMEGAQAAQPECNGLDTPERVRFYEHDFYPLSNFSAFGIEWEGRWFPTSEHAYHWEKFYDGDPRAEANTPIAYQIMNAPSAHEAFKTAERNRHLRRSDWDSVKVDVMRRILRAKVDQHEYVRRKLLATGDRELVEDSWRDDFWGWGPNRDGQNMLGKLWMEIRAELRAHPPTGEPT